MRPGDAEPTTQRHDRGEDLGPAQDRDPPGVRGLHLHVVLGDRRADHHRVERGGEVLGPLRHRALHAEESEAVQAGVLAHVGAGHVVAELGEHRGVGAHARAAGADDVDPARLREVDAELRR